jgi:hypothetical protein
MVGEWREVPLDELVEVYDGPHATPKMTPAQYSWVSQISHAGDLNYRTQSISRKKTSGNGLDGSPRSRVTLCSHMKHDLEKRP